MSPRWVSIPGISSKHTSRYHLFRTEINEDTTRSAMSCYVHLFLNLRSEHVLWDGCRKSWHSFRAIMRTAEPHARSQPGVGELCANAVGARLSKASGGSLRVRIENETNKNELKANIINRYRPKQTPTPWGYTFSFSVCLVDRANRRFKLNLEAGVLTWGTNYLKLPSTRRLLRIHA